jgi:hypothetical protein
MAGLQVSLAQVALTSVVAPQLAAIERQCENVLRIYSEQSRHYMSRQEALEDELLEVRDPLTALMLRSRIRVIDATLADIRADAQLLFAQMCLFLNVVGRPGMTVAREVSATLALPPASEG